MYIMLYLSINLFIYLSIHIHSTLSCNTVAVLFKLALETTLFPRPVAHDRKIVLDKDDRMLCQNENRVQGYK